MTTDPRATPPAPRARVLVVDDEESMRYFVSRALRRRGFEVDATADGEDAIARWSRRPADVAVVDLKMPGTDGMEVLAGLRALDPDATVILMTAYGTIRSAVDAMRHGAFDYLTKPFEADELELVVDRALRLRATIRENRELRRMLDASCAYAGLVGQSPAMRAVFDQIELLRGSDATVLIEGESGTGKELVARAIHASSARSAGPFVALHCAALSDALLENELFGHETGAFTGADSPKAGLVARAAGGTLLLDEIGETSLAAQAKIEHFVGEREYLPLGGSTPVRADVRIIAATNRDLEEQVRQGAFRADLFWRLHVVPIRIPPLRQRRQDIPLLVDHVLARLAEARGSAPPAVAVGAMTALANRSWPGNVRELQNTVERLALLAGDRPRIEFGDLPADLRGEEPARQPPDFGDAAFAEAAAGFERDYFRYLFSRTGGNITEAARLAGLSRGHLHRKIKGLGVDPESFRS